MENYSLFDNPVKESEKSDKIQPAHNLQLDKNVINMNVKTGSKVNNLMNYACNKFDNDDIKQITWNGSGDALNKVVACAEIMKKRFKDLYQINKIGFTNTEDIWYSKNENLRDIRVTKQVPSMSIILSKTPLDPNEPGYQTNNTIQEIYNSNPSKKSNQPNKKSENLNNSDGGIYVKKRKPNK